MADPTENGHTEGDGGSIAERAAAAAAGDVQEELFEMGVLEGDPFTLAELTKLKHDGRPVPVEVTVALSRAEVPMRAGLPDPRKAGRVAVTHEVAKYEPVIVREENELGEREIVKLKIRAHLRATYVDPLGTPEEAVFKNFQSLVVDDPQRAQEVADELVKYAARLGRPEGESASAD
jgi:hypothetical protein